MTRSLLSIVAFAAGLLLAGSTHAQTPRRAERVAAHPDIRDSLLRRDKARLAAVVALSSAFDSTGINRPSTVAEANGVHTENAAWLMRTLQRYGWLGPRAVGGDGAEAADRLLTHSTQDTLLMAVALPLVERAFREGDARGAQVAYLTDHLAIARGRPQTYGTAIQFPGGMASSGPRIAPIADSARVDERRAALGLRPLRESVRTLQEIWSVGTGSRPRIQ